MASQIYAYKNAVGSDHCCLLTHDGNNMMANQKDKFYQLIKVTVLLKGHDQTDTHPIAGSVHLLTFLGNNILKNP